MKSDPPTPTRAPDNQFGKTNIYYIILERHQFAKLLGLGSGVPIPSVILLGRCCSQHDNANSNKL